MGNVGTMMLQGSGVVVCGGLYNVILVKKAEGKVQRNFKRKQVIHAVEKLMDIRTKMYPLYLARKVQLVTILG